MSTCCVACGEVVPSLRLADPAAPARVALLDAGAIHVLAQTHGEDSRGLGDALLGLLARASRYARCPSCGALTALGGAGESWIPGPAAPPAEGQRRVVVVPSPRVAFEELWRGERCVEIVTLPCDIGAGDRIRLVETMDDEARDPREVPRHVLALVTHVMVLDRAPDGSGWAALSLRIVLRGEEDRSLEGRRARLVNALDASGSRVAGAATLLGLSVGEAYRWVHELGLEDRIKAYRSRKRNVKGVPS